MGPPVCALNADMGGQYAWLTVPYLCRRLAADG